MRVRTYIKEIKQRDSICYVSSDAEIVELITVDSSLPESIVTGISTFEYGHDFECNNDVIKCRNCGGIYIGG